MIKKLIITGLLIGTMCVWATYHFTKQYYETKIDSLIWGIYGRRGSPTALQLAAYISDYRLVKEILEKGTPRINKKVIDARSEEWPYTPLVEAISDIRYGLNNLLKPDVKVAELLIKHGANVNVDNGVAIRKAITSGKPEMLELLIKNGADLNLLKKYPITPLEKITMLYNPKIGDILRKAAESQSLLEKTNT